MKDNKKILNLLGVGLDTELAQKATAADFTLTKLRQANKSELVQHFSDQEVDLIWKAVKRKPIPQDILQRLVKECDWKCCVCWNWRETLPVIIHHIEEHSKTGDDSYDNLVVLCLNHHGIAHSEWKISRHPLPPEFIRAKKEEFIEALAEFKAGRRPAPGCEAPIAGSGDYVSATQDGIQDIAELVKESLERTTKIELLLMQRPPVQTPQAILLDNASLPPKAQQQFILAQCQAELDGNPSSWKAWLGQAGAYYELEDMDKALVAVNRAWELGGPSLQVASVRGCILAEYAIANKGPRSMLNEAISLFESLRNKTSEPSSVDYNIGNCYAGLNEHEKAIEHFNQALTANPSPELAAQIWKNRGTSYFHLENYDEEIASYKKALEQNPHLFEAYASWGATESHRGRFQQARDLLEKAFEVEPKREMSSYPQLYTLAYALWRLNDLEESYWRVNQVLILQPLHQDGLLLKAYLLSQLWRKDSQYVPGAIAYFESRVLDNPEDTASRGELYLIYNSDEYQHDARSVLEETALSANAPPQSLYHYAMLLEDENRVEEAIECLEAAFEKNQEHHIVHALGRLKEKAEDYNGAIAFYELAVQDVTDPIPILHGIADCYHFLGEYKECTRVLTRAILVDPRDEVSWTNLRYSLTQLGEEVLFVIFLYYLRKLRRGDDIADEEAEAAVSELLSRLRVKFGDEFVATIKSTAAI